MFFGPINMDLGLHSTAEILIHIAFIERVIESTLTGPLGPVIPIPQGHIDTTTGYVILYIWMKDDVSFFDGLLDLPVAIYSQFSPPTFIPIVRET